jgi:hypothetical protein
MRAEKISAAVRAFVVWRARPDASRDAMEASFLRLARDHHPDHGGSHETMAALNEGTNMTQIGDSLSASIIYAMN